MHQSNVKCLTKTNKWLDSIIKLHVLALLRNHFSISTKKKKSFQKHPSWGFLQESFMKICIKFTGKHPCRSVISIKLQDNFQEIVHRHWCCPVNLLHIFRTPFYKNTYRGMLLMITLFLATVSYIEVLGYTHSTRIPELARDCCDVAKFFILTIVNYFIHTIKNTWFVYSGGSIAITHSSILSSSKSCIYDIKKISTFPAK